MPYGVTHFFPGGTKEQYEATMLAANGRLGAIPEGQIFHAAGPAPGGWRITGVHDSKENWDRFTEKFYPMLKDGIEGGFSTPPEDLTWNVTHFYS
jgi:hypothetical protein